PEQREHHDGRPACPKDRGRDVEVSQFRQKIAERNQGQTATPWFEPGHEIRGWLDRLARERRWRRAERIRWRTVNLGSRSYVRCCYETSKEDDQAGSHSWAAEGAAGESGLFVDRTSTHQDDTG